MDSWVLITAAATTGCLVMRCPPWCSTATLERHITTSIITTVTLTTKSPTTIATVTTITTTATTITITKAKNDRHQPYMYDHALSTIQKCFIERVYKKVIILIMLLFRSKRYIFLLNRFMSRDELNFLLKNKYALSLVPEPSNIHPQTNQEEASFSNKYNLSAAEKQLQKEGRTKSKEAQQKNKQGTDGKGEPKFQIKPPKGTRDYYPDQMAIRRKVMDTVASIFKKHGGVELDTPVFELKEVLTGKYGEDSKLIYDLQDQGGQKCSLRYDLTVPFARFMANNTNIQKIKRFHIGKVYRRDQPTITKGRFREFYQCDFDIAGKYDAMIPDAEVLAIMQQILEALDIQDFQVKVNHRVVLEIMIKEAGCHPDMFKTICSSIDKLDKQPWAEIEVELKAKGVNEEQCKIMQKLTAFKGDPLKLLAELTSKNIFEKEGEKLKEILRQMEKLFKYLEAMKRLKKVSFDLSLARGLDYYTGVIYEIVLTDKANELGSISGGGRYDNLIGMFCSHQIPAVGGSLGIERLFTILESKYKNKAKQNECEILVATIGKIPVQTKLAILSDLWRNDIKAETLYVEKAKPDKQIGHAFDNEIPMILWLGEEELKAGEAKIKILYKHEEFKIKIDNLAENLGPYIRAFREDYALGNVVLVDPKKKQ